MLDLMLGDIFGWGLGKGITGRAEGKRKSETEQDGNEKQVGKKVGGGGAWRRIIGGFVDVSFVRRVLAR